MKHPALARVFAIVLAVMCFVMLTAGVGGLRNALNDRESDAQSLELLLKRIDAVSALEAELADKPSYSEQNDGLNTVKTQYESDSAQHRTDLATYSATRGGTKMGADALWEAKAQTEGVRSQLESALTQLETGEAAYALYQSAVASAAECTAYSDEAQAGLAALSTAATDAQTAAATAGAAASQLPDATQESVAAALKMAAGQSLMAASPGIEAAMPNRADYTNAKDRALVILGQVAALSGTPFDSSMIPPNIDVTVDVADMQGTMVQAGTAQTVLSNLSTYITQFTANCGMDATTGATLAVSRTQLETAFAQLDAGEQEIQWNLELIWYQNGELLKDASELEERKTALENEGERIGELEAMAEQRKKDENEYKSLCILLRKNDNIEAAEKAGGDLVESARAEADRLELDNNYIFSMRLIICGIAVLGALAGFASLPSSFEKGKSRLLLILPLLVCLICAVGAAALSFYVGRGALYSAIFTAPFALIQLIVAAPRKTNQN